MPIAQPGHTLVSTGDGAACGDAAAATGTRLRPIDGRCGGGHRAASKATVYRRWPSKAELVLAAFIEGIRQVAVPPETGTLRGDLLRLGELICEQAAQHATTMRAVLVEASRNRALNDVMQHEFVDQRKALIRHVLQQAVDRGEIDAAAISDELWDLLPGYLIFRSIIPAGRRPRRPCRPWSTT
ncbi:bacterial regulatory s, tetR family protein [Mycobacterium xenopi 4042]|uniref:Bacterial regulatory s, tetR family protein n=1 Tax=Mycobacterium xenopi 4042 TaxID=1299334 RepID=X8DM65_MYCXE|nr:bacterial regulatory s, tetR family protein [Mycobacterium xenopi 4042]